MEFKMQFKMDNAAFTDYPEGEVKRILSEVTYEVENGQTYGVIMDYNGNKVGKWEIETD